MNLFLEKQKEENENFVNEIAVAVYDLKNMHSRLMESNGPIDRMYSKVAETTKLVDRDTVAEFRAEDFYISADFYEESM